LSLAFSTAKNAFNKKALCHIQPFLARLTEMCNLPDLVKAKTVVKTEESSVKIKK